MSNQFLTRLSAILILVVAILLYCLGCSNKRKDDTISNQTNLIQALTDSLHTFKLNDSSQLAQIDILMSEKVEDILIMKSNDSAITALQNVVKKYEKQLKTGGSVTVVKGETKIADSSKTDQVYIPNHVDSGSVIVYPTYKKLITNKWFTANLKMNKDSTFFNLKVINSYDVIIGKDPKDKTWFADVINHNPYSSTTAMRVYKVDVPKERQKRVCLFLYGGYGIPLQGTVQFTPQAGIGIGYKLLSLF
jgi:hypothetical protein